MRVEVAGWGEMEEVLALERGSEGAPHWSEDVWRELLAGGGTELRAWRVWVVRGQAGEVVGCAVLTMVRSAGVAELESVVVEEGWRRRGVGRAMCEAGVGWARGMGAESVELEVWEGNEAARAMYAGMGFAEVGRRRGYYGQGRDAALMRLELGRGGRGDAPL